MDLKNELLWLKENYPKMVDVDKFDEIRTKYLKGKLEVAYEDEIQSLKQTKYMSSYEELLAIEEQNGLPQGYFQKRGIKLGKTGKLGMIVLNGGVATSYEKELGYRPTKGIFQAIMLTPISFIAIKLHAIYQFQKEGILIPTYFMNSPATDKDTRDYLAKFNNFNLQIQPMCFCQDSGWPRITPQGNVIVRKNGRQASIIPKGHGDVYQAFERSGLYDKFINDGDEILLICNVDNSEATINLAIAGYFSWLNERWCVEIMFESAQQSCDDKKGGKCVLLRKSDGKMGPGILELTRISPRLQKDLENINEFNTNIAWLHTSIDRRLFDLPFRAVKQTMQSDVDNQEINKSGNKQVHLIEVIQFEHEMHKIMELVQSSHGHILFVPREERFWPNKYFSDQIDKQKQLIEKYKDLYDWMFELNPQANECILPIKEELLNQHGFKKEMITSQIRIRE
ncbi:MAG: UTP--glucose-1-phosphate uridylyltransferase [Nitrospirota bacterium]